METWKAFDQNVISHSAAHHLMAIDELLRRLGYARVSDVARTLNITRGSVSVSLQPLKDAGLVLQDENRHLRLSPQGQSLVDAIRTKRLVMNRLLGEFFGVDAVHAEIDACKMEHLLSNATAQRLVSFLRFLDAHAPEVEKFRHEWAEHDANCSHKPELCASCENVCLADTVSAAPEPAGEIRE